MVRIMGKPISSWIKGYPYFLFVICIHLSHGYLSNGISLSGASYPWEGNSDSAFNHYVMEMYPYKPKSHNLDPVKLLKRMKSNFNPMWMSVTQPTEQIANKKTLQYFNHQNELLREIGEINFTYADENGEVVELKDINRKVVEKWLQQKATCAVYFKWRDLGILFWPRWIKQGYCDTRSTCSWPTGMHCVPAESNPIRILNWQCQTRNRRKKKRVDPEMFPDAAASDISGSHPNLTWYQPQASSVLNIPPLKATDAIKRLNNKRKNKKRKQKLRCKWTSVRYPLVTNCFCSC